MLLFAHTGITVGAAALVTGILHNKATQERSGKMSWFGELNRRIDIRVLLAGSMLPDIIDKPLGHYFLAEYIGTGRAYAHTLLFLLLLVIGGVLLLKIRRSNQLLVLAGGTAAHITLDGMWANTRVLFWPLMGTSFVPVDLDSWARRIIEVLSSDAMVFIPEIIGFAVIAWLGVTILRQRKTYRFLRYGELD